MVKLNVVGLKVQRCLDGLRETAQELMIILIYLSSPGWFFSVVVPMVLMVPVA